MAIYQASANRICDCVAIVGVGLIGGSLAAALKTFGIAGEVIGVGRSLARLHLARDLKLVDSVETSLTNAARQADLIIFCTPVDKIEEGVREAVEVCSSETVLTDVGSVKRPVCEALARGSSVVRNYVGSHPMAGSEKRGCEYADPTLFTGKRCIITPMPATSEHAVDVVTRMWKGVGGDVLETTPIEHDSWVAQGSHVPHVMASVLAGSLSLEADAFAATGFRDCTRIADGDVDLWTGILMHNARQVANGIETLQQGLREFQRALDRGETETVRQLLEAGRASRERWKRGFLKETPAQRTNPTEDKNDLGS